MGHHCPIPEAHHGAFAYQYQDLDKFLNPSEVIADKGYQGLGMITPVKKWNSSMRTSA
jgi:transposase